MIHTYCVSSLALIKQWNLYEIDAVLFINLKIMFQFFWLLFRTRIWRVSLLFLNYKTRKSSNLKAILCFYYNLFKFKITLTNFFSGLEFVSPSYRMVVGVVMQMFFSIGFFLSSGLALIFINWRYFQLAITAPTLFYLTYHLLVILMFFCLL